MKVLQINSVCGYGSTGRIAADLSRYLTQSGDDCLIAYGRGQAPDDVKSFRIGTDFDVNLHGVCSRITDKHGFYSKRATQRFIRSAGEYDPDIIHLHNLHGYYLHLPTLFEWLRECGKPIVWTLHDCWAFTGHCSYFDFVGCDRWKTGCHDCPQKREYPASFVMDHSESNFKEKKEWFTSIPKLQIITPSNWLKDLAKQSFFKNYPIATIHNGIDLNQFKPTGSSFREKNHLTNKTMLLSVANVWESRKGFDYLLELSQRLDDTFCIVVVGLTEQQCHSLSNHMLGITRTDDLNELVKIYSAADIFLNPTLEDNYPTTNLEAIACGTPVITFDTGGCSETVSAGCGYVVPKGNLEEMISQVKRLGSIHYQMNHEKWLTHRNSMDQKIQCQKTVALYHQFV